MEKKKNQTPKKSALSKKVFAAKAKEAENVKVTAKKLREIGFPNLAELISG